MTTSQTKYSINGLEVSVYGLTEYKLLPPNTPVAVMFALHGRLQDKTKMEAISQVLCSLNGHKGGALKPRHLLVVTFDHENHGTRLENKKMNYGWKHDSKQHNPNHAIDQWRMMQSAAQTVSALMNVLESHLFGKHRPVERWGCLGFSMGAHSSYLVASSGNTIYIYIYTYI
ncbi:hypothetical protein BC941DRAFT_359213 [Chlamydoabsidia padenii]|nr:hypothetical protein BC941DRAFT_359213 [Chlamydoabsidia padenii]